MASLIESILGKLFIYFILAIMTCSLVEAFLVSMRARSVILGEWLYSTFDKTVVMPDGRQSSLGEALMSHPSIKGLAGRGSVPSYIDPRNFSTALLEILTFHPDNPEKVVLQIDDLIDDLKKTTILSTQLKRVFLGFAYEAVEEGSNNNVGNINKVKYFREQVENWFNSTMGALTGTFKVKYARPITFFIAFVIVSALNVDTIRFVKLLYYNSTETPQIIEPHVVNTVNSTLLNSIDLIHPRSKSDSMIIESMRSEIITDTKKSAEQSLERERMKESNSFSIGWQADQLKDDGHYSVNEIVQKMSGLLATILITFLIAPLLFDMGSKVSNIRGGGPKPATVTE